MYYYYNTIMEPNPKWNMRQKKVSKVSIWYYYVSLFIVIVHTG